MKYNYNIKYINSNENNNNNFIIEDIFNLKYKEIKNKKHIYLKINFDKMNIKQYKKIIKKFQKIKEKIVKINNFLFNIEIFVYGFDEKNSKHSDFMYAVEAIMKPNRREKYNYIYDIVCDYLDYYFINKNLCEFKDNRCGEKRETSCLVGCCRHFKHKKFGALLPNDKLTVCEYLKNKRCVAKCISCKLFTCDYLHKKGVKFKLKDIFLIDTFFNPIQKYFIKYKVFTPKEKIIKLLLKF